MNINYLPFSSKQNKEIGFLGCKEHLISIGTYGSIGSFL
jgi:hypothetical protein